jgi:hypothetical protein
MKKYVELIEGKLLHSFTEDDLVILKETILSSTEESPLKGKVEALTNDNYWEVKFSDEEIGSLKNLLKNTNLFNKLKPGLKGGYGIGNAGDSPSKTRPRIGSLIANIITNHSILEGFVQHVFLGVVGNNSKEATIIYAELPNQSAKIKVLKQLVAQLIFEKKVQDVLKIFLRKYESISEFRNKIAHWIYGASKSIPNGVLMVSPRNSLMMKLGFLGLEGIDIAFQEMANGMWVYYEEDFKIESDKLEELINLSLSISQFLSRYNHIYALKQRCKLDVKLYEEEELKKIRIALEKLA